MTRQQCCQLITKCDVKIFIAYLVLSDTWYHLHLFGPLALAENVDKLLLNYSFIMLLKFCLFLLASRSMRFLKKFVKTSMKMNSHGTLLWCTQPRATLIAFWLATTLTTSCRGNEHPCESISIHDTLHSDTHSLLRLSLHSDWLLHWQLLVVEMSIHARADQFTTRCILIHTVSCDSHYIQNGYDIDNFLSCKWASMQEQINSRHVALMHTTSCDSHCILIGYCIDNFLSCKWASIDIWCTNKHT